MYRIHAMKVNIGTAAKEFGIAQETLRRWKRLGKIEVELSMSFVKANNCAELRTTSRCYRCGL
jgi:hypothetical protein